MIPDSYITERRLKAVRELPWPIPAAVLVEMTDEDLDRLSAATKRDYWRVLNTIVTRISERRLTA
jgi:hypothetical protein